MLKFTEIKFEIWRVTFFMYPTTEKIGEGLLVIFCLFYLGVYDDLTKTKGPNNILKLNDQLLNTAI